MENFKKAFGFSSIDETVLLSSSSGGAFHHLAEAFILKLNGVVYGSTIEQGNVHHIRIDKIENITKLQKSKYVYSDIDKSYLFCEKDLVNDKFVMYCGTPCQIYGLLRYLNSRETNTKKLYTIDFICHGTPDPRYWNLYTVLKFKNEKILDTDFRFKKNSWGDFSIKIVTDKRVYVKKAYDDIYMRAFLFNYILRPNCFECKFKGAIRESNLTLGDYWGYKGEQLNKKLGISLIVENKKSPFFNPLEVLGLNGKIQEVDFFNATKTNAAYYECAKKPANYDLFLKLYQENDYKRIYALLKKPSFFIRLIRKIFK